MSKAKPFHELISLQECMQSQYSSQSDGNELLVTEAENGHAYNNIFHAVFL